MDVDSDEDNKDIKNMEVPGAIERAQYEKELKEIADYGFHFGSEYHSKDSDDPGFVDPEADPSAICPVTGKPMSKESSEVAQGLSLEEGVYIINHQ